MIVLGCRLTTCLKHIKNEQTTLSVRAGEAIVDNAYITCIFFFFEDGQEQTMVQDFLKVLDIDYSGVWGRMEDSATRYPKVEDLKFKHKSCEAKEKLH